MPDTVKPMTLADVIDQIDAHGELSATRRRDLQSAIRRMCKHLGRDPGSLPASLTALRGPVAKLNHAQLGLSPKTLLNMRSDFLAALSLNGQVSELRRPLSSEWQALTAGLVSKRLRNGLGRFVRYLSDSGLSPSDVSDLEVDRFIAHLKTDTLLSDQQIRDRHRRTTRLWNEARETVATWPDVNLAVPNHRKPRTTLSLSAFPASFQNDVSAYLSWLSDIDPLLEDRPGKAIKASTCKLRRTQITLAASALVESGTEVENIVGLADLVTEEAFKAILRRYIDGKAIRTTARALAQLLCAIAKDWVKLPADDLDQLKGLKRRLGSQPVGLTVKNRDTLRQFDDQENCRLLLELPAQLFQEALNGRNPARDAVKAQIAIAIEILIFCPLRMINLVSLRFGKSLIRPGGKRGPWIIALSADETKNEEAAEFELPRHLCDMIDRYFEGWRTIGASATEFLFVNQHGEQKAQATLSQQIEQVVKKRTGLRLTPHQYRHLCAKLYLLQATRWRCGIWAGRRPWRLRNPHMARRVMPWRSVWAGSDKKKNVPTGWLGRRGGSVRSRPVTATRSMSGPGSDHRPNRGLMFQLRLHVSRMIATLRMERVGAPVRCWKRPIDGTGKAAPWRSL